MKFLLLVGFCCMATGFPNGAPDIACKEMVPGHLPTVTSGDNPFKLNISVTSYKPGDVITGNYYLLGIILLRSFIHSLDK
jgi:hypothetical protein